MMRGRWGRTLIFIRRDRDRRRQGHLSIPTSRTFCSDEIPVQEQKQPSCGNMDLEKPLADLNRKDGTAPTHYQGYNSRSLSIKSRWSPTAHFSFRSLRRAGEEIRRWEQDGYVLGIGASTAC